MNGFKILSYDFSLSKNEMIDHLNENGIKYELKENNLIVYQLDVFYATLIYKNDKLDRVKIRFAKLSPEDQNALAIQLDSKYFLFIRKFYQHIYVNLY